MAKKSMKKPAAAKKTAKKPMPPAKAPMGKTKNPASGGLTAKQKKLPPALQAALMKKKGAKK